MIRNILFIVFGIIKAFYIVGTFMHLKHERLNLILTIILPVVFIIFFIVWMLYEGNFWGSFN
jgi:cytochrome c oxidase subunit IV